MRNALREEGSSRCRRERYREVTRGVRNGVSQSGRKVEAAPPAAGVAPTAIDYFRLVSAKLQFTMFQKASTYFARALR